MITGHKKLTREENKHLAENKCANIVLFKRTLKKQAQLEKALDNGQTVCWVCRIIASKLGLKRP